MRACVRVREARPAQSCALRRSQSARERAATGARAGMRVRRAGRQARSCARARACASRGCTRTKQMIKTCQQKERVSRQHNAQQRGKGLSLSNHALFSLSPLSLSLHIYAGKQQEVRGKGTGKKAGEKGEGSKVRLSLLSLSIHTCTACRDTHKGNARERQATGKQEGKGRGKERRETVHNNRYTMY